MRYHIINFEQIKMRSIIITVFLLFIATNVKSQSVLEISSGASITVTSGADICADSIIGIIQGEGTICGGVNSIDPGKDGEAPKVFALDQNYPNPFNPTTSIQYQVSSISQVTLKAYDVLGNEVATLVNEEQPAGTYEATFDASQFASGIYFYSLVAGSFTETKKMLMIK
jgi:hypothetical protein